MSEEKDTHDLIVESMLEYIKWHEKYEHCFSKDSSVKARNALQRIKDLCHERRQQILDDREEKRRIRKDRLKAKSK
jgi:hypothetical protein